MQAKQYLTGFLILAAVCAFIFAKSRNYEFVEWDDGFFIYENETIMAFTADNLKSMFLDQHYGIYTPVLWLSLAFDFYLYQFDASGYRITNLVFHILNMGLILYLFKYFVDTRKFSSREILIASVAAVLLWGIHPLRVESIVWTSQRRDVLSAFFCLLSLICYIQYSAKFASRSSFLWSETHKKQDWKYLLSIFLYLLALLSKPSVVPFPVVLILVDIYPLKRYPFDSAILLRLITSVVEKWAYFLLGICAAVLTLVSHGYIKGIYPLSMLSLEDRFSNAVYCLGMYFIDTVIPFSLQPYYAKQSLSFFDPMILMALIFFGGVTYKLYRLAVEQKSYWGLTVIGVYFFMLFPILGFFQAGSGGGGNRFTYLATLPFFFVLGAFMLRMKGRSWFWMLITLWGAGLAAKSVHQQNIWRDSEAYFEAMIEMEEESPASVYNKLANIKYEDGKTKEALKLYDDGLRTDGTPEQWGNSFNGIGNIYFSLSNVSNADQKRNLKKAEFFYRQAVSSDPESHLAHNNLGNINVRKGLLEDAEHSYKKALKYDRDYSGAYYNLGLLYRMQKRYDDAEKYIHAASILMPHDAEVATMLNTVRIEKATASSAESEGQK